jgi:hypothetical protein
MFDQRTIELFKLKNNVKTNATLSVDLVTNYIHQYLSPNAASITTISTPESSYSNSSTSRAALLARASKQSSKTATWP